MEESKPTQAPVMEPAGFWVRGGALVLDGVFCFLVFLLFIFALSWLELGLGFFTPLAGLPITFLYAGIMTGRGGQTFGKILAGIVVISADGSKIGYGRAFFRSVGLHVSFLLFGLGFVSAVFSKERKALHDLLAGTKVVFPEPVTKVRRGIMIALGVMSFLVPAAMAGFVLWYAF